MMQSSGYFFAGSKSAGLINTPSIVVPSVLFHEITSRVPSMNGFVCSVMFVRTRGEKLAHVGNEDFVQRSWRCGGERELPSVARQ